MIKILRGAGALVHALNPSEIFLLLICLASGILRLSGAGQADPLSALLPRWVVLYWTSMLIAGPVIALTGLATLSWPGRRHIPVTRIGYTLLGSSSAAYGVALVPYAHHAADWVTVGTLITFALVCIWRCVQIYRVLRGAL